MFSFARVCSPNIGVTSYTNSVTWCWSSPLVLTPSGLMQCMNHYSLVVFYMLPLVLHGNSGSPPPFWTWSRNCLQCGIHRSLMNGLFCTNFVHYRACWKPCLNFWCGSCYTAHHLDKFFRFIPTDEEGFEWHPQEESMHHIQARDTDPLPI